MGSHLRPMQNGRFIPCLVTYRPHLGSGGRGHPETRARNPFSVAAMSLFPSLPGILSAQALETHIMYSSLFSSVTRMLSPPSFSSWVVTLPKISMSWMKYSSNPHSSRLFSLGTREHRGKMSTLEGSSLHPAPSLIFSAHETGGLTSGLGEISGAALWGT